MIQGVNRKTFFFFVQNVTVICSGGERDSLELA